MSIIGACGDAGGAVNGDQDGPRMLETRSSSKPSETVLWNCSISGERSDELILQSLKSKSPKELPEFLAVAAWLYN
ncbi:hypothetical protein ColTof3_07939 [Colletotrichum tofieldiae]|nr:hypothetical protein ColTof3_07939 [Colletotrichum tofieldiae]